MAQRVLIVEDDEVLREIYSMKFNLEGFDVAAAADGQEGLERIKLHRPHLIVLDMLMPTIGGLEFLKRFKNTPAAAGVKVLVASNKSSEELSAAAMALGACEYLIKSQHTPQEIVAKARKHLAAA
ncbi:MAG: hypothetical protein NVSMB39_3260 [Candidatus Saccharimonadales bacterium]